MAQSNGQTPLMLAAANRHEAVVPLLLSRHDVDPDIRGSCGWTALTFAASQGHDEAALSLLKQGNASGASRGEALSFAAFRGHV